MGFVKVTTIDEIAPGRGKLVEVAGKHIALFNVEGEYFAIDDVCTQEEAPLSVGAIAGYEVTCPLHGAKFDVRSGEVLGSPAVRVSGEDVEVDAG